MLHIKSACNNNDWKEDGGGWNLYPITLKIMKFIPITSTSHYEILGTQAYHVIWNELQENWNCLSQMLLDGIL